MEKCAASAFVIVIHSVMGVNFFVSVVAIDAVPILEARLRWVIWASHL